MSCFIIKDVIDRLDKSLYEDYENTKNNLLVLWEKYYINLKEDARTDEYERLKKTYFDIGNEYEKLLSDRSKIDDDILYKRFMIMQRKTGIRMIVAAKGTIFEEEAKSFESQQSNTPAGDRSVTNIRFNARNKQRQQSSGSYYNQDILKFSFIDFLKMMIKTPEFRKQIIMQVLFSMSMELIRFLITIIILRSHAKKAIYNKYLSDLISNIIGEHIDIKIISSDRFDMFGYFNNIILSKKVINSLNEDEIIAISLFIYGSNKNMASRGLFLGSIKTIISTSVSLGLSYIYNLEYMKTGDVTYIIRNIQAGFIKDAVLMILFGILDIKLSTNDAIKFVKEKGYIKQFVNVRKKLPTEVAKRFPNIDQETMEKSVKHFTNMLNMIKIKENVDKDNLSTPISLMNKAISIFKKF